MRRTHPPAGFTLLEVMMALAVVLVGAVGLIRFQIIGLNGNQGARAQGYAAALARELAGGLQGLAYDDTRLPTTGSAGATPPAGFGSLLGDASAATSWDDTKPIAGVTQDASIERDTDGTPLYKRRWTVWNLQDGGGDAVKIIAVSVVYHERGVSAAREVLLYAENVSAQNAVANSQAFR